MVFKKIIVLVFVPFLCVFARNTKADDFDIWDDSENDSVIDANQDEEIVKGLERNRLTHEKSSEDYVQADVNERKKEVSFFRQKRHLGIRTNLGFAYHQYYFQGAGGNARVGFAYNYFFFRKWAIQTGLDLRYGYMKEWVGGDEISFWGLSVPSTLRYGNRFWGEFGIRLDYNMWGIYKYDYYSYNEYYGEPQIYRNQDVIEKKLYPDFIAGFGWNLPVGDWKIDFGIYASCALFDYWDFEPISIGAVLIYWR